MDIRKNFFTERQLDMGKEVPGEVAQSLSPEVFKEKLGVALCHGGVCSELAPDGLRGLFQSS